MMVKKLSGLDNAITPLASMPPLVASLRTVEPFCPSKVIRVR
jgi:hypothetical protein